MAINKRKVLDAARKYAQKGAKQKALKEYNKLIQSDPRDAKLLLELGDAYRRWGQVEEAIAQYHKVAGQYKESGFDARAVAVLKQILNLDPKRYTAHVSLAELYQRMGLEADAISALQTAADACYQEGRRREALDLLRKMGALDPSNTTSRLKVADLLRQENLEDEAVAEYEEVAVELERQAATEQLLHVQERILELRPDRVDLLAGLAESLISLGKPERAEPFASRALQAERTPEHFERLIGIYKTLDDVGRLTEVTRALAALYRERGDEDEARSVLQRLPSEDVLPGAGLGADQSEVDRDALLADDEVLGDDEFLVGNDDGDDFDLDGDFSLDAPVDSPDVEPSAAAEPEPAENPPLPEGDPEQLLAEASVYLRYGKRDQAVANLRGILAQEPGHRGALEKLGEAHVEAGETAEAVAAYSLALEAARGEGDSEGFALLHDRMAALDPAAAAAIEPMSAGAVSAPAEDEPHLEIDLDLGDEELLESPEAPEPTLSEAADQGIAIDLDEGLDLDGASEGVETGGFEIDLDGGFDLDVGSEAASEGDAQGIDLAEDGEGSGLEIEIDFDGRDEETPDASDGMDASAEMDFDFAETSGQRPDAPEPEAAADESSGIDFDIDVDLGLDPGAEDEGVAPPIEAHDHDPGADVDIEIDLEASAAAPARVRAESSSTDGGQSTTTSAQIKEDLEEAEFYIQQGLSDEAEGIYRRILTLVPNHPSALLKLGELLAERGQDPGDLTTSAAPSAEAARAAGERGADAQSGEQSGEEPSEDASDAVGPDLDDVDIDLQAALAEAAGSVADPTEEAPAEAGAAAGLEIDVEIGLEDEHETSDESALAQSGAEPRAEAPPVDDAPAEDIDAADDFGFDLGAAMEEGDEEPVEIEARSEPGPPASADGAPPSGEDATEVEHLGLVPAEAEEDAFESEPVMAEPEPNGFADETQPLAPASAEQPPEPDARSEPLAAAVAESEAGGGMFDLTEELSDVFDAEEEDEASRAAVAEDANATSQGEDGFRSLFADFKKGVSATLDEGDYDTRFDLGIAYREMGLFEDAIAEFKVCLGSDARRFESLSMLGVCAFDLGRFSDAVNHLEQALAMQDEPVERQAGVYFDLGRAYCGVGDVERAHAAFRKVRALDPGFPGIDQQIANIEAGGTGLELQAGGADSPFEPFDEVTEDNPEGDGVFVEDSPESFESFDDVITEAAGDVEPIADVEVEPEPAEPASPDPGSTGSGRRPGGRKKISFV